MQVRKMLASTRNHAAICPRHACCHEFPSPLRCCDVEIVPKESLAMKIIQENVGFLRPQVHRSLAASYICSPSR